MAPRLWRWSDRSSNDKVLRAAEIQFADVLCFQGRPFPCYTILNLLFSSEIQDRVNRTIYGSSCSYVIACSSFRAVPLFEPRAVPSSRPAERRSRRAQGRSRPAVALGLRRAPALPGCALTAPARREDQAGRTPASSVLVSSKARPLASTAQAMRASLLASAIASTLWCNRLLAASIQDLSP
jgi:hypothetical protein